MAVEGENTALHELLAVARQQAPSAALPESSTAAEAIAAIVASGDHSRFSAEEAARLCAAGVPQLLCEMLADSSSSTEAKLPASVLAGWGAYRDKSFRHRLLCDGPSCSASIIQQLSLLCDGMAGNAAGQSMVLWSLRQLLHRSDGPAFSTAVDQMFKSGFMATLLSLLSAQDPVDMEATPVPTWAALIFLRLAAALNFNERLRDLGLVKAAAAVLKKQGATWQPPSEAKPGTPAPLVCDPKSGAGICLSILYHMSRSDAVSKSVKECELLPVLGVIIQRSTGSVRMTTAMLVAHMYSSEARSREACAMLHDSGVSKMLVDALSAALQTRKSSDGKAQEFSKAELLHGLQSVTWSKPLTGQVVAAGAIALLVKVIHTHSSQVPWGSQESSKPVAEAGSAVDMVLKACRTLLHMALHCGHQEQLVDDGVAEAVRPLQQAVDGQLATAARAILVQLGMHDSVMKLPGEGGWGSKSAGSSPSKTSMQQSPFDSANQTGPVPWVVHQQQLQTLRDEMARMQQDMARERQALRAELTSHVTASNATQQALKEQVVSLVTRLDAIANKNLSHATSWPQSPQNITALPVRPAVSLPSLMGAGSPAHAALARASASQAESAGAGEAEPGRERERESLPPVKGFGRRYGGHVGRGERPVPAIGAAMLHNRFR